MATIKVQKEFMAALDKTHILYLFTVELGTAAIMSGAGGGDVQDVMFSWGGWQLEFNREWHRGTVYSKMGLWPRLEMPHWKYIRSLYSFVAGPFNKTEGTSLVI